MKRWYFQVSNEKDDTAAYFEADCGSFCPTHCIGKWWTWKTVDDPWEKDSTLEVNSQGNK